VSLGVCIPDLIANGKIGAEYADELRGLYDELLAQHEPRMGREAAEALATSQAVAAWEKGLKQARRERLLQLRRQTSMLHDAQTGYRGADPDGPIAARAMAAFLAWDRKATYSNVEYRERAIRGEALGDLYAMLERHRANLLGEVRNKSDLIDVVHELFGRDSGNLNAREIAGAWRETSEMLRRRFNAAGGAIGKREDWGLPQSHDPLRVGSVTPDGWIREVLPTLDRAKMLDERTGMPLGDARLEVLLRDVYETIVSDGWIGRQPGAGGQKMLANRRADRRVLHFRDAEAWIAYNDKFGQSSPWDAMMGHVRGMSRDIAMMEVLGPNPAATVRWMKDVTEQSAAMKGDQRARDAARKAGNTIDRLWGVLTGEADRPHSTTLAHVGSAVRNWEAGSKLGSAVISSFSDQGTAALTRRFNGLSSMTQLPDMVRALADPRAKETARRSGFISDEWIGKASGAGRLQLDELTGGRLQAGSGLGDRARQGAQLANEGMRRLADGVLRASGLNATTIATRETMAKEFAATFAEHADTAFGDLDPALRGFFQRYGMGARDWDVLRAIAPNRDAGYAAIWPKMLDDPALRSRVMEAMLTEIDFAVPTGGVRQKALVSGYQRGTVMGELVRTGFQFKMFPVTVMAMHGMRMFDQAGPWRMARYGISFLGATTLMGALSYQVANLTKGKDPASMFNADGSPRADFWRRAVLKGGGLGVFGDAVSLSTNEYGQKIGDIVVGPGWSSAQNVAALIWGKEVTGPDGKKHHERDLAKFLKRESPLGSLWYTRLAWEHLVVDQLGEMQGEDYAKSYDRLRKRAEAEGSGYFAPPGTRPSEWRSPDLGNAVRPAPPVDGSPPPE
jgi:hypothetical protein